jgi:sporulation protein YlmC with PRC-barrel domain
MIDFALLDDLRHDAEVVSADGKDVGSLHAIVVHPRDDQVTSIVINTGPHFPAPGFGAPELKDVPIEEMADAREGKVILKCTMEKLADMPSYVDRKFAWEIAPRPQTNDPPQSTEHPRRLWEVGAMLDASLSLGRGLAGIPIPLETFRKAQFERHILNDAPVWRESPHEKIGEIERVLIDEDDDEIQALVIRPGFFFERDVVLPIDYVTEILDGVVRVQLSEGEIDGLEPFAAPP